MSLLNPLLLATGLAAIAIPILVHLQRRRRKVRVVFSSLQLVEECQRITRRRRRITDLPILLLRILAVGLVALAFGRPWLENMASSPLGHKETVVYMLDQSASMHAVGEVGPVWDEVVDVMTRAMDDCHPDSRVTLITTPAGEAASQIKWVKPSRLLSEIKKTKPGYGRADLAIALNRAGSALNRVENDYPKVVHLISDLQNDATRNLDRAALPANVAIRVSKVGDLEPYNVGLLASVKGKGELRRGVYGLQVPQSGATVLGKLTIQEFDSGGSPLDEPREVTAKSGSLAVTQAYAAAEQGWFSRRIKLDQEDALPIDNEVFDAFYVQTRADVLLVEPNIHAETFDQDTFFISRALDPFIGESDKSKRPTRFVPKTVAMRNAPQEIRRLEPTSSVVFLPAARTLGGELSKSLKDFVAAGGGLVVFSGESVRPEIYNQYLGDILPVSISDSEPVKLRASLEYISERHPLWGGLDISNRQKMVRLPLFRRSKTTPVDGAIVLARFGDGAPLVSQKEIRQGRVLFVNTSAARRWSDWPTMGGSFVPTMHVLAARSLPDTRKSHRNADVQLTFEEVMTFAICAEYAGKMVTLDNEELEVDENGTISVSFPTKPGLYTVKLGDEIVRLFAANLDPRESNLESTQSVVVKQQLESQRTQSDESSLATKFGEENDRWIWMTALGVLAMVLAIEPLLANFS